VRRLPRRAPGPGQRGHQDRGASPPGAAAARFGSPGDPRRTRRAPRPPPQRGPGRWGRRSAVAALPTRPGRRPGSARPARAPATGQRPAPARRDRAHAAGARRRGLTRSPPPRGAGTEQREPAPHAGTALAFSRGHSFPVSCDPGNKSWLNRFPDPGGAGMRTQDLATAMAPQAHPRQLARAREAVLAGQRPPTMPRPVIAKSWQRVREQGVDPDCGSANHPVPAGEVHQRRLRCGLSGEALQALRGGLVPAAERAGHIVVIVDADGRVLWREGHLRAMRNADQLGFIEGASWRETEVGTNAIGTALVEEAPVQVHSCEHYVRSHHPWTCAAAPLHDPRDGRLLGAVDVSGPADTVHPSTLALVHAVAGLAKARLWEQHRAHLDRLRAVGTPMLAKLNGQALVIVHTGWVAASTGLPPIDRVALPADLDQPRIWLPAFGTCLVEPLP